MVEETGGHGENHRPAVSLTNFITYGCIEYSSFEYLRYEINNSVLGIDFYLYQQTGDCLLQLVLEIHERKETNTTTEQ